MPDVLAHLSDIHLPLAAFPSLRELAGKRLLSLLSWQTKRRHVHIAAALAAVLRDIENHNPDMLAITGDLTNLGSAGEFRAARKWLTGLSRPAAVIPGNHDMLVPEAWQDGPGMWSSAGGMVQPDVPSVVRTGNTALIGVNSGEPTPPFFASGRVGAVQAERLRDVLRQTGEEGLCRVVMIHHPPRPDLVVWRKALRDTDLFARVVREAGAELILHGHSHRGTFTTLPGSDIPVAGVTSASHRPGNLRTAAGWNEISISREGAEAWKIIVEARRLEPGGQCVGFETHRYMRPAFRAAAQGGCGA